MKQNIYIPKHYMLCELVSPVEYQKLALAGLVDFEVKNDRVIGESVHSRVWNHFLPESLKDLDTIRDKFGVTVVNNWYKVGGYAKVLVSGNTKRMREIYGSQDGIIKNAGTRPYYEPSIGKPTSMHCAWMAFDAKCHHATADKVRQYILSHQHKFSMTRLEDGVDWVHMDYLYTGLKKIFVFAI